MIAGVVTRHSRMILLIGNYPADQQQSMQRFANMMLRGLTTADLPVEMIQPQPYLGRVTFAGPFVAKWLGYLDKFLIFPWRLKWALAKQSPELVHICDHSNAMYAARIQGLPVVVSCHDLLAVRGALGEVPDTPASATGKYLQRWILSGLRRATAIACASSAPGAMPGDSLGKKRAGRKSCSSIMESTILIANRGRSVRVRCCRKFLNSISSGPSFSMWDPTCV
jgi:hypothetical protein